ncbi:MAG TPA: DUF3352 domain-containing protein [Candidatus Limnocylindria bacterium]
MARRLVIALTTLLTLTAGVVLAAYLFIFSASADPLARAVPSGSLAYATVYLQPSAGQKMNLAALLQHVPGFSDADALDVKLHQIAARLAGQAGLDYERDVRPWLGDQVAVAALVADGDVRTISLLAVVDVRDHAAAEAALERIAANLGSAPRSEDYEGVTVHDTPDLAWALLDDVLLVGQGGDALHAALDAFAGRRDSLADDRRYLAAARDIPADHLAAAFFDSAALVSPGSDSPVSLTGYPTAAVALVAEADAIRVEGAIPADAATAPPQVAAALEASRQAARLPDWIPADSDAALSWFGVAPLLAAAEDRLTADGAATELTDALNQLRALAALGLGIDVDADLLPLFDGEVALAASSLTEEHPAFLLVAQPSDPGAVSSLERVVGILRDRGVTAEEREVEGTAITTVRIPEIGAVSYATLDGVVLGALDPDVVAAALRAHATGEVLSRSERYAHTWRQLGTEAGNQLYVDVAALSDRLGDRLALDTDTRAILHAVEALGARGPAGDDRIELHAILTVR